jgi:CHASE2 domain-containing sensor protein
VLATIVAAIALAVFDDRPATWPEWVNVGILAMGSAYVYITTNHYDDPIWQYAKAIASGLALVGVVLISAYSGGDFTRTEVVQIAVAFLGSAGVLFANPDKQMIDTSWGRHAKREE